MESFSPPNHSPKESTWAGLQSGQNPVWDLNHGLLIRMTHLVPGLSEDQFLCVSVRTESSKRQSIRQEIDLII